MIEVYSNPDFTIVGFLKSELDSAGIACYIRNQNTNTVMAAVPTTLFWPVLCIVDDDDLDGAKAIIAAFMKAQRSTETNGHDWVCKKCGEAVPASFGICWNCMAPRGQG